LAILAFKYIAWSKAHFYGASSLKKICTILAVLFVFSAFVRAQVPDDTLKQAANDTLKKVKVTEIYLAKDDGSGNAGEESEDFVVTDIPIYCVVQLNSDHPVTVKMNLVAVSVAGVRADTKVVSTSYMTKDKQNRVNFSGKPYGNWVAGKYRADIFVNDSLAASRSFVVQKLIVPKDAVKPAPKT
jgi:hypothetical protein